jgi:lipopolysaccharide/colanic/teichoic acid biosynthesis glycosyltransferase
MIDKNFDEFIIRFFDIIFSLIAIIILFPFMIPIMVILKLTGEHYIFYRQKRVGRYGREFDLFKFATMLLDSPNLPGGYFTYKDDPRLLPLGKFLRKAKINELPQLLNILMGQMSIVGYRPLVRKGYEAYSYEIKQRIYNSKPGLTGLGSIVMRNEEEIMQKIDENRKDDFYNDVILQYKGNLEVWYMENNNIPNYFKIIFITALVVLKPSSALWKRVFKNVPPLPQKLAAFM